MRRSFSLTSLRVVDRILGLSILVLLTPALAALALIIRVLSRRSPFVSHLRIGTNGKAFWMLKYRTMWTSRSPVNTESGLVERIQSIEVLPIKPKLDPRVTSAFAAWCRVHSVDELPQLWHVVTGEMSLVGPRPLTASEVDEYYGRNASDLLAIPPGMTGLWQVRGRNTLTYRKRTRLDLFLVKKYGWGIYWMLIAQTLPRLFSGAGAW